MSLKSLSNMFTAQRARLLAPGNCTRTIPGRKFGISNGALDDLTEIPGVLIAPEPGGIQLEVVSTDAADGVGGTGIQTLELYYLDSNGVETEEVITMNGLTPVNTTALDIDFVQWIHSAVVGSGGVAAGNISVRNTAGDTTYEYLVAGGNQSLSGRYKVPAGHTGYVTGWQCSGFTQRIDLRLRATVERISRALLPGIFLFQDIIVLKDAASGWRPFFVPLRMPAGTVVKMSGLSAANVDGDGAGSFDITVVPD